MTPAQAAALLGIAASADNRKADPEVAKAWAIYLDGLRYEDCLAVVVAHYQRSREWLMPADIWAGVKRLREKRIMEYGPIEPPADLDPDDTSAYARFITDTKRRIGDGTLTPPPAIDLGRRDVIAELGHVGRGIDE